MGEGWGLERRVSRGGRVDLRRFTEDWGQVGTDERSEEIMCLAVTPVCLSDYISLVLGTQ